MSNTIILTESNVIDDAKARAIKDELEQWRRDHYSAGEQRPSRVEHGGQVAIRSWHDMYPNLALLLELVTE